MVYLSSLILICLLTEGCALQFGIRRGERCQTKDVPIYFIDGTVGNLHYTTCSQSEGLRNELKQTPPQRIEY